MVDMQAAINRVADHVAQSQRITTTQLQHLTAGGLTFRLEARPTPTSPLPDLLGAATIEGIGSGIGSGIGLSRYASAQASVIATPIIRTPSPPLAVAAAVPAADAVDAVNSVNSIAVEPPRYCMCRSIKTINSLWHEWTEGLQGQPSIRELDSRWRTRWRSGRRSELQWYSLRLEIIREIERTARSRRTSEEMAIWTLHHEQIRTGSSIDQFCKRLRASRKVREAHAAS
jgi:Transcriptional activator of glycolytic enzymes